MDIKIYSRSAIKELIQNGFPKNTAVISFFSPKGARCSDRVCYDGVCHRVFYVEAPDIDIEILGDYGYTYDTYLANTDSLAEFICKAHKDNVDIICQCDYGQSRSAACAAAILQHFERRGIEIFADYRYYPNQLVYNKIFDTLKKYKQ